MYLYIHIYIYICLYIYLDTICVLVCSDGYYTAVAVCLRSILSSQVQVLLAQAIARVARQMVSIAGRTAGGTGDGLNKVIESDRMSLTRWMPHAGVAKRKEGFPQQVVVLSGISTRSFSHKPVNLRLRGSAFQQSQLVLPQSACWLLFSRLLRMWLDITSTCIAATRVTSLRIPPRKKLLVGRIQLKAAVSFSQVDYRRSCANLGLVFLHEAIFQVCLSASWRCCFLHPLRRMSPKSGPRATCFLYLGWQGPLGVVVESYFPVKVAQFYV